MYAYNLQYHNTPPYKDPSHTCLISTNLAMLQGINCTASKNEGNKGYKNQNLTVNKVQMSE